MNSARFNTPFQPELFGLQACPLARSTTQLRDDALAIWQAGVDAVRPQRLIPEWIARRRNALVIGDEAYDLAGVRRLIVVGAGKAGAAMAAALEQVLGDELCREKSLAGWVNVPTDCVMPLRHIHLHGARPAGSNEPTTAGVAGTEEIVRLVSQAKADDLVICLLSGGGSALMPLPEAGISLADKLTVTQALSAHGANIAELNTVRKQLSAVKGGKLAQACTARRLISLIISDVAGDPLDVIASGPTVPDLSTPADALAVLHKYAAQGAQFPAPVLTYLQRHRVQLASHPRQPRAAVANLVIANNATAVDAAGMEAERRGYSHAMQSSKTLEGAAEDVGRHLARLAVAMLMQSGPDCLISGGEPVVTLAPVPRRGLGGRNQQLALAALQELVNIRGQHAARGLTLLSAGSDGEDGPTDAAGAVIDEAVAAAAHESGLSPADYLNRNDAYHFFDATGGLIRTGPTHTNVCDLRVVLADRPPQSG